MTLFDRLFTNANGGFIFYVNSARTLCLVTISFSAVIVEIVLAL